MVLQYSGLEYAVLYKMLFISGAIGVFSVLPLTYVAQVEYPSRIALMRRYFKPNLPTDVYRYGLDKGTHGTTVRQMSQEIVEK